MCKKQTAVSHSSAESAIVSLDAGLRTDGLPALQFGDCVLETLSSRPAKGHLERHTRERIIPSHSLHSDTCVLEPIDQVPPNITNSSHSTQLYIFEDNAAVIQMINKGRSAKPEAHHKNAQSRFGLVVRGDNLDHSMLMKYVEQQIKRWIFCQSEYSPQWSGIHC